MNNNLNALNNYLFESIERLVDDELTDDELQREIRRADAVKGVAATIIENGKLALSVKKHLDEYGVGENYALPLLEEK